MRLKRLTGALLGLVCAVAVAASLWLAIGGRSVPSQGVWAGQWDTSWPDGSARIELRQHGDTVEGTYRLYDGRLVGKASGNRLEGDWTEGARHGRFVFVLGPFGGGFTGRFDGDAWWTGTRTSAGEVRPKIRDASPKEALRSFTIAGNLTAAGYPDAMADAMRMVDFGAEAEALDGRQRLARTKALFDAVDLTTFAIWALDDPPPDANAITYTLAQAGTDATLALTLLRLADGHWRIAAPAPEALAARYAILLRRDGGHRPAADAMLALRSPRDTMLGFVNGMLHWDGGGARRVLDTMDLSDIREGYRADQGQVQAEYMLQVINRVGAWQWQEIPDDPASRQPFVFFTHPLGRIVIAPQGEGDKTRWRFTADTVTSQLRLYVVTADMPAGWRTPAMAPAGGLFLLRERIAMLSPYLLARSVVPGMENWQLGAIVMAISVATLAITLGVPLVIRLFGVLLRRLGQPMDERLQRRLVWPLRLLVIALIWFKLSRRIGMAGPSLPAFDSLMGVVAAVGVAWAGLPIVDAIARGLHGHARRTAGTLDDILVSLTAGLLCLAIGVALAAAQACDIPVEGMIAGLGIGGLAIAFASRETLANLLGAGILLADRPFRNGDLIAVGEVRGTVEGVGIRSTRIRTLDDTLVVLPNGKLSDALINNFGARRHRLFRTKFRLCYGATPEQLAGFTRKLHDLVDGHATTADHRTQVGLWDLSNEGIEIDLVCYLHARTLAEEHVARHHLLLEVTRLAQEEGLTFAIVT